MQNSSGDIGLLLLLGLLLVVLILAGLCYFGGLYALFFVGAPVVAVPVYVVYKLIKNKE